MARPALSAERAIRIVDYLAANPGRGHTMSELARELAVNTASMHAVLSALLAAGYVTREPDRKTYRLGSSLAAIGQAALDDQPAIRRAREETSALAKRLRLECLASINVGADVIIVGEEGRPERLHYRPRVGQRLPFMPPIGILGAALMSDNERDAWLARMGPGHEAEKDAFCRAGDAMRSRGVEIGLETPTRSLIGMLMVELAGDPRSPELLARLRELVAQLGRDDDHHLLEPQRGRTYPVNHISAPIYGPHRELLVGLTLLGFDTELSSEQIEEYTRILIGTCTDITLSSGGRIPLEL